MTLTFCQLPSVFGQGIGSLAAISFAQRTLGSYCSFVKGGQDALDFQKLGMVTHALAVCVHAQTGIGF